MQIIIKKFQKWKKAVAITIFLILAFIAGNSTGFAKNDLTSQRQVLSAKTTTVASSTPPAGESPIPTTVPITIINNIIVPTLAPTTLTQTPTPIPTVQPTSIPTPTQQPTVTVAPTPPSGVTPTPIVSPTSGATPSPVTQSVEIDIDYAGEHTASIYTVSVTSGETAWQAVQDAVGLTNLQYIDYGGSLGIFITGFNGVDASSNKYYDFQVNGTSSNVGVSTYVVENGDVLKFILTNF